MSAASETDNPGDEKRPWYREGWLWFVISIPALSIPLGISMIIIALNTNNSLVVDDYYVQGKTINQRIERDNYASSHGISAVTTPSDTGFSVALLRKSNSVPISNVLRLRWIHVTQDSLDGYIELFRIGDTNTYFGPWRSIEATGRLSETAVFRLHLEPENMQWRLVGELNELNKPQHLIAKPALR